MQYYATHMGASCMAQKVMHRLDNAILLCNILYSTDSSKREPLGRLSPGLGMFLSAHYTHDRCTLHAELNIMLPIYCHNGYDTTISTASRIYKIERSGISNFNG